MGPGYEYSFPDSPILDISHQTPGVSSSITTAGDMYFIEYSMSNYTPGIGGNGFSSFTADLTDGKEPNTKLFITSSFSDATLGYDLTGSLYITKGNTLSNNSSFGSFILSNQFIVPNEAQNGVRVNLTGSYGYEFLNSDSFRLGVEANKNFGSGFEILEYSMSIFPSQSDDPI